MDALSASIGRFVRRHFREEWGKQGLLSAFMQQEKPLHMGGPSVSHHTGSSWLPKVSGALHGKGTLYDQGFRVAAATTRAEQAGCAGIRSRETRRPSVASFHKAFRMKPLWTGIGAQGVPQQLQKERFSSSAPSCGSPVLGGKVGGARSQPSLGQILSS